MAVSREAPAADDEEEAPKKKKAKVEPEEEEEAPKKKKKSKAPPAEEEEEETPKVCASPRASPARVAFVNPKPSDFLGTEISTAVWWKFRRIAPVCTSARPFL